MLFLRKVCLNAVAAIGLAIPVAHALTVSPLQLEMTSAGSRSHAQVTVVNTDSAPLPVEAVVQRLSLDENGRQITSKSGEDFLIMPPQAIIPPGGTQNFRVQWLGDPLLQRSESFVLSISQVPVKLVQSKPGVQVVMALGVVINVAPAEGAPHLSVVGSGVVTDKAGKRWPSITVENSSNVHALLPQATIQLSSGSWSSTLTPQTLDNGNLGIGLVQPGKRRKFTLPVEVPQGIAKFDSKIDLPPARH